MMSEEEIRLECLKLALARDGAKDARHFREIYADYCALVLRPPGNAEAGQGRLEADPPLKRPRGRPRKADKGPKRLPAASPESPDA